MTKRPPVQRLETFRPRDDRAGGRPGAMPPPHPGQQMPRIAQRKPPRRRSGWGRRIAWGLGGLLVLLVAAIGLATVFVPVDFVRDRLVREVKARTGRDLVVAGPTSLTIVPQLGVSMADVTLSGPAGMTGGPFLKMKRMSASAALWPLLQRQLNIESVVLVEPVLDLRVDAQGRRNWDFAEALPAMPRRVQLAQAGGGTPAELKDFMRNASPPTGKQAAGARVAALDELSIGEVRIDNGSVRYRDEKSGANEEVKAINARLTAKSLASPVEAKGNLALRGEKIDFDTRLSTPKAMMENRPARLVLTLAFPQMTGRYDGTVNLAQGPQLEGALRLDTPSVRRLAAWAGAQIPAGGGLGTLAFKGDIKTGPTWLALGNANLKLDDTTATGTVNVDLVAGRPTVKANLKVSHLDLNTYLPAEGAGARSPAPAPAGGFQPKGAGPSIEDLIRRNDGAAPKASPQVRAAEHRSGWSEDPINVAALGALDVDARIGLAGLAYREIKIGGTQLVLDLKNRQLKTTIEEMRLYEGSGRGIVTLNGAQPLPVVGVNLNFDAVSALPLLKDSAQIDWLAGKGKLQIALAGQGPHQRAIMESLNGKADFRFTDGAIIGFNIPAMIRGLGQGRITGFDKMASEKTDFSEAGVSFQVKGGVAETKDLSLASPLLRITGAGTVGIGQRQVDMTVRPKLVASLAGQGGGAATGLEIPVKIKGPWEKPAFGPDMDAVLKDPSKAVDAVKGVVKQLQGKDAGNAVRNLLGRGGGAQSGGTPPDAQQGKGGAANQLLQQFMKK